MPMFFEFIEVLLGGSPCGKTNDDVSPAKEFDVDVRPGSLASATQDSGVAESEAVDKPEEAPVEEEKVNNTEVEGLEFTELTDSLLGNEADLRAEENTEERDAEQADEEEEESEEDAEPQPDPKMVECMRGLHKRDAYIRKEQVMKMKNSMEHERKRGQQRIKNIFELHKNGGTQKREDTATKRPAAKSGRRQLNYFGGAASVHGSVHGQ